MLAVFMLDCKNLLKYGLNGVFWEVWNSCSAHTMTNNGCIFTIASKRIPYPLPHKLFRVGWLVKSIVRIERTCCFNPYNNKGVVSKQEQVYLPSFYVRLTALCCNSLIAPRPSACVSSLRALRLNYSCPSEIIIDFTGQALRVSKQRIIPYNIIARRCRGYLSVPCRNQR